MERILSISLMVMCLLNICNYINWKLEKEKRILARLELLDYKRQYKELFEKYTEEKIKRQYKLVKPLNNDGWENA